MHHSHLLYNFFLSIFLTSGSLFGQNSESIPAPESSYLLLPSAYTPQKGQVYLENIAVGIFGAEYGISKYFSGKVSFELFNPIFADEAPTLTLTPKLSLPITEHIRFGASFINIIGFDNGYVGIPHAVLTFGKKGKHLSLGYGHAFYNFFGVNTTFDGVTIGGQYSFSNKWSVVTDNWVLIGEPSDPFANDFDFFSLGLSNRIKDKFLLSFGLTYFTEDEDLGNNPWPYIKISGNTHDLFKIKKGHKSTRPKIIKAIMKGEHPAKAIFAEGLGIGIIYSLNYDARLAKRPKNDGFGFRMGLGFYEVLFVPIQFNYLIGFKHYLELGSGITFASKKLDLGRGSYGGANITPSSSIGYRYQPEDTGLVFRVSADVFYQFVLNDEGIRPWFGLSIGYKL